MKTKQSFKRFIFGIVTLLICGIAFVTVLFTSFLSKYRSNIVDESAEHLIEISYQIRSNIESQVLIDWQVIDSIANGVSRNHSSGETEVIQLIQKERKTWNVSDIIVFTENGECFSATGTFFMNNDFARMVASARINGKHMSIMDSSIAYTVPVTTDLYIGGSSITAISLVHDMGSFFDDMGFSSFSGKAFMYLTQSDGSKISQLTHKDAPKVENVYALFEDVEYRCISSEQMKIQELMENKDIGSLLVKTNLATYYVVLMPVEVGGFLWQLCYFVPEVAVNETTDSFTAYVTFLSLGTIIAFSVLAMLSFVGLYQSRKKLFNQAIISRERMMDLLIKNTQNAFALFTDDRNDFVFKSSNLERIIGYELTGVSHENGILQLCVAEGNEEEISGVNQMLAAWSKKEAFVSYYTPFNRNGTNGFYVLRIYPASDLNEYVLIAQDVTIEQERETMLRTALKDADSANESKTRFLANMSHDIRTPMNAIINMAEFATEHAANDTIMQGYLSTISSSSQHLLHIINDILDMSRIESGHSELLAEPFALSQIFRSVLEIVRPLYESRHQQLFVNLSGIRVTTVIGDHVKLSQILINLINNAVKFTPVNGRIDFIVTEVPSLRDDVVTIEFTVKDNGMGIPADKVERIFDPFVRVDETAARRVEGTGLGLAICKNFATLMGGGVSCESEFGVGSIFTLELPFGVASVPKDDDTRIASDNSEWSELFRGKRALLCEDNEINRMIAVTILERLGFTVETACDGQEGLMKFLASPPGYYDIIYMDIQMPIMDGYETACGIRASDHVQARTIPVVAMTANVFADDIGKSQTAGMNGHIGKPINRKELVDITIDVFLQS